MKDDIEKTLHELTRQKENLNKHRPLPSRLVNDLRNDFFIKSTFHSNAIEGNTLTVFETKAILEDGITIAGKSMQEHLEAINHKQAIIFMKEIANDQEVLSEKIIKDIHAIILHGIDRLNAGIYRNRNVMISGASHKPPSHFEVPDLMTGLIDWYDKVTTSHPIEKAAILHSKFVNIHPFIDGNGRTARLLMNLELLKTGYLPIIIEHNQRFEYYELLDTAAVEKDYDPFIKFIANYEQKELSRYIQLIGEYSASE